MVKEVKKTTGRKTASAKKPATATAKPKPAPKTDVASAEADPSFELTTSRQFESWFAEQDASLAFTTYQAGKLFFLGLRDDGKLAVFNRTLERCMGIASSGNALYVATLYQILKFVDAAAETPADGPYDTFYVPQVSYYTGDVDAHDLAVTASGETIFVNTLFSCVATLSQTHSFKPVWTPPFIDRLAAEDRCHLNGLALDDKGLAYVTAVAETNVADGWRDHRDDGGVVIDVRSGNTIASGLSMPHSPRLYDGRLWLHNSGTGYFGFIDPAKCEFEPVAFCPGYLRGLDIINGFAIVGLSKPRGNKTFSGLALDDNLAANKVEPRCGLYVIDLKSGDVAHWLRIGGVISELYDVAVLPGRRNIAAIGFQSDEIRRVVSIEI